MYKFYRYLIDRPARPIQAGARTHTCTQGERERRGRESKERKGGQEGGMEVVEIQKFSHMLSSCCHIHHLLPPLSLSLSLSPLSISLSSLSKSLSSLSPLAVPPPHPHSLTLSPSLSLSRLLALLSGRCS